MSVLQGYLILILPVKLLPAFKLRKQCQCMFTSVNSVSALYMTAEYVMRIQCHILRQKLQEFCSCTVTMF